MGARDYSAALDALSSLITTRIRGTGANRGDAFDLMSHYVHVAGLEESLSKLNVIHVAGTKGKGSTCVFSESILRECGYKTGLFTSPHLLDVRERFRVNKDNVSEHVFLKNFWWCWDKFKENLASDVPMPTYFRFLTLLAFKIFVDEEVDVAILEVGLGGRFDATNVVKEPAVCGVSSLGFDHMEILGYTLAEIAAEKAGIFKVGVPAFVVPQPSEAMAVLQKKASDLDIRLQVVSPLTPEQLKGAELGLEGDHQLINAALAVALCGTWAERCHKENHTAMLREANEQGCLPEPYIRGLANAQLLGRAQQLQDPFVSSLAFFLDGAHSPESMEVCGKWFCSAVRKKNNDFRMMMPASSNGKNRQHVLSSTLQENDHASDVDISISRRVLVMNCMPQRDPKLLLSPLVNVCSNFGLPFHHALFVPGLSSYSSVTIGSLSSKSNEKEDLSWQFSIQNIWENLVHSKREGKPSIAEHAIHSKDFITDFEKLKKANKVYGALTSSVVPSLPIALDLLRQHAREHPALQLQVLVTGSLHLVGDVIRILKK